MEKGQTLFHIEREDVEKGLTLFHMEWEWWMKRNADRATVPREARTWPARVGLGAWVAFLAALLVADPSWLPVGLFAGTVALVAGSAVLGALSGAQMQAEILAHAARAKKGEPVACELAVRNASALPVWRAVAVLGLSNPATGERTQLALPVQIGPRGEARVPFEVESPWCGAIALSCDCAFALDVLGIVRRRRPLAAQARVAVAPAALPVGIGRAGARAHDIESFTYAADRPGDDPAETFAVREYAPGDSVRRIHWKLSGKLGATMLRESGFPIYSSLLLLVETGWMEGELLPKAADAQMEAVAALMASLLEAGVAFELAYLDRGSGAVVVRRVVDEAQMWDAIGLLLASPRVEDAASCIGAFMQANVDTVWAHAVYVTAGAAGADAARLAAGGGVLTVLRCSDEAAPIAWMDGYEELKFAPATWQEDLEGVVL